MVTKITEGLTTVYKEQKAKADDSLTEVLASAYKDATGEYPSIRVHEAILEAVRSR